MIVLPVGIFISSLSWGYDGSGCGVSLTAAFQVAYSLSVAVRKTKIRPFSPKKYTGPSMRPSIFFYQRDSSLVLVLVRYGNPTQELLHYANIEDINILVGTGSCQRVAMNVGDKKGGQYQQAIAHFLPYDIT
jgi:hypothetical protein